MFHGDGLDLFHKPQPCVCRFTIRAGTVFFLLSEALTASCSLPTHSPPLPHRPGEDPGGLKLLSHLKGLHTVKLAGKQPCVDRFHIEFG